MVSAFCVPYIILKEVYNEKKVQKVADFGHFLFSDRGDRGLAFNFCCRLFFIKIPLPPTPAKLIEDTG
jgi:hypothetical protein